MSPVVRARDGRPIGAAPAAPNRGQIPISAGSAVAAVSGRESMNVAGSISERRMAAFPACDQVRYPDG
jgi:hypothetical protein